MTIEIIAIRQARLQLRGMRAGVVALRTFVTGVQGIKAAEPLQKELTGIGDQTDALLDDVETIDGTLSEALAPDTPPAND